MRNKLPAVPCPLIAFLLAAQRVADLHLQNRIRPDLVPGFPGRLFPFLPRVRIPERIKSVQALRINARGRVFAFFFFPFFFLYFSFGSFLLFSVFFRFFFFKNQIIFWFRLVFFGFVWFCLVFVGFFCFRMVSIFPRPSALFSVLRKRLADFLFPDNIRTEHRPQDPLRARQLRFFAILGIANHGQQQPAFFFICQRFRDFVEIRPDLQK